MLNKPILDNNKKKLVSNWISTEVSAEKIKIKPFNVNLAPAMTDLANGRVSLKFNNSVLMQKSSYLLYSNFNLYIFMN